MCITDEELKTLRMELTNFLLWRKCVRVWQHVRSVFVGPHDLEPEEF